MKIQIKNNHLKVYEVDSNYRKYLENLDNRISQKDNRKFYGILIKKDEHEYCIPFTSRVKHRNSKLTINIRNKGKIIARLLLNNMIPIIDKNVRLVEVNKEKYADYLKSEIIYLSNKIIVNEIINKTENMFNVLENKKHIDYNFFKSICCDFSLLETNYKNYKV